MGISLGTRAESEIIQFLAGNPTPEQIIGFHLTPEVAERAYELVDTERERTLAPEERQELDTYLYLEHFIRLLKAETHLRLTKRSA